jgi:hypothetical protein
MCSYLIDAIAQSNKTQSKISEIPAKALARISRIPPDELLTWINMNQSHTKPTDTGTLWKPMFYKR